MNYEPILTQLFYWKSYNGSGDAYRQTHDRDCVLTGGNLFADTLFSLWLPLRYTLSYFEHPRWTYWKEFESTCLSSQHLRLKNYKPFLDELSSNIDCYIPEHELTRKLIYLFSLGQKRCNVFLLPYRKWNSLRGRPPYYDYLPHFLHDIMSYAKDPAQIVQWIQEENLTLFFQDNVIDKDHLLDLAGTGNVCKHTPKEISLFDLLDNYISILEQRAQQLNIPA